MKSSITSNQTEQVATFTADAARTGARTAMERIAQNGNITKDDLQKRVIEKGDELTRFVSEKIAGLLEGKLLEMLMIMLGHLKVIMAGSVRVSATPRTKTADCLKKDGTVIGGRDGDLDCWLSSHVPEISGGTINCFELTQPEGTKFCQMAEAVLGMTGSDADLKKALRERGMSFHPQQVRDLIVRTEAGENTGLHKDGKANLFFIEDENEEIFGLSVRRAGLLALRRPLLRQRLRVGFGAIVSSLATSLCKQARFRSLGLWTLGFKGTFARMSLFAILKKILLTFPFSKQRIEVTKSFSAVLFC